VTRVLAFGVMQHCHVHFPAPYAPVPHVNVKRGETGHSRVYSMMLLGAGYCLGRCDTVRRTDRLPSVTFSITRDIEIEYQGERAAGRGLCAGDL
jgi:hypothetical protein